MEWLLFQIKKNNVNNLQNFESLYHKNVIKSVSYSVSHVQRHHLSSLTQVAQGKFE